MYTDGSEVMLGIPGKIINGTPKGAFSRIGGEPTWHTDSVDFQLPFKCPLCSESMYFIAQIYTPLEKVYIYLCNSNMVCCM